jgi:hypothetical protein
MLALPGVNIELELGRIWIRKRPDIEVLEPVTSSPGSASTAPMLGFIAST